MPFTMIRDDITRVRADALVNAANEQLRQGGGVCGAIFRAAGARRLQAACNRIGHCETGSAVATKAFDLPARYVIHAVGPVWAGGARDERELLAGAYRSSLELARSLGCRSVAFPLISAGIYGYPKREALEVAQQEIRRFLDTNDMQVTLVLYEPGAVKLADTVRQRVERYIDDVYVGAHAASARREAWEPDYSQLMAAEKRASEDLDSTSSLFGAAVEDAEERAVCSEAPMVTGYAAPSAPAMSTAPTAAPSAPAAPRASAALSAPTAAPAAREKGRPRAASHPRRSLKDLLNHLDAGFSETLLSMIDERGLKDAQVYKRANISRQHFSKMRSNPRYRPTKPTVLALAVALELPLADTELLLERAGFALSHADKRDVIVEYFISEGTYDIFQINEALFAFDQPLLG